MNVDKWSGTLIHLLRGLAWAKGNKILYCAQDFVIISNCSRIRHFCTLLYNSLAILALVMGRRNRLAVAAKLWRGGGGIQPRSGCSELVGEGGTKNTVANRCCTPLGSEPDLAHTPLGI